ncbi:hypothetical protein LZ32DRAFT_603636 [Colletotrichum eremochloae]|nr:hypothetical protein LZ32DRAFT_603636 [Colletotrichum eremochloae]
MPCCVGWLSRLLRDILPTPFHAKEEGRTPLKLRRLILLASLPVVFSPQLYPSIGANKYARRIVATKASLNAVRACTSIALFEDS